MRAARADLFAEPVASPAAPRRPEAAAPVDQGDPRCAICGERAAFGFGVFLRKGRMGRWSCLGHRDEVEGLGE